ncbi:hypothetical protein ACUODJ_32615, partial [Escherichia sp. HC-CC]
MQNASKQFQNGELALNPAKALQEAVKKLNPQAQWRNPVMFIVWIGSL